MTGYRQKNLSVVSPQLIKHAPNMSFSFFVSRVLGQYTLFALFDY